MSRIWDAIIVGAGPAGAITARELAKRQRSVLLLDKASFPRDKVCGCCLGSVGIDALKRSGLANLLSSRSAIPLKSVCLASGANQVELKTTHGVSISRSEFDLALIESAQAVGARFQPESQVIATSLQGDFREIVVRQNQLTISLSAKLVIAADGLNSRLLGDPPEISIDSRIGAGTILESAPAAFAPGTIYMACGRGGYVGLVRLEDQRLDLAAAFDPDWVRDSGSLAQAAKRILDTTRWPQLEQLESAMWRGTPTLTRHRKSLGANRLFAVGDAASYVEPFTGEGMSWALASGMALAPIADRAIASWDHRLIREWTGTHQRLLGSRQRFCRWTAQWLRSPRATRLLIRVLSLVPALAKPYLWQLHRLPSSN